MAASPDSSLSQEKSESPPSPAASNPSELPHIPTTATTSPKNYGRLNAENEAVLPLLVTAFGNSHKSYAPFPSNDWATRSEQVDDQPQIMPARLVTRMPVRRKAGSTSSLLGLPSELIVAILAHLSAYDLSSVTTTCHHLRTHALLELHWKSLVQKNVPGDHVLNPGPCSTFRELYASLHNLWFLPRHKIWFGDRDLLGKILLVQYNQRRGRIEGYELVAHNKKNTYYAWPADPKVIIHGFDPQVALHFDKRVLEFKAGDVDNPRGGCPDASHFTDEIPNLIPERSSHIFSNIIFTKPLEGPCADTKLNSHYPYGDIWPPPAIPALHHVSGVHGDNYVLPERPVHRSEVSDLSFRIRRWFTHFPSSHHLSQAEPSVVPDLPGRWGEEITTYSTLDPLLYTPTPTKPWRGIWIGDYSGHGCEFLLMNQPDDAPATDVDLGIERLAYETDEQWEKRRLDARVYRGRLEAIKLTGDPNVPRGEYTFIADDLGSDGYIGVSTESPFTGVRVVKSKGHVAATGFERDKFIETQLLLISPNCLAQYWVGFGHISFFHRVNIDDHLVPEL